MREDFVFLTEMLIQLQDGGNIPATVAVVRGAPDGDYRLVEHELESFHCKLVRPSNEVNRVVVREELGDICAEQEACATRGESPPRNV